MHVTLKFLGPDLHLYSTADLDLTETLRSASYGNFWIRILKFPFLNLGIFIVGIQVRILILRLPFLGPEIFTEFRTYSEIFVLSGPDLDF